MTRKLCSSIDFLYSEVARFFLLIFALIEGRWTLVAPSPFLVFTSLMLNGHLSTSVQ
jgi:hypothetical protein